VNALTNPKYTENDGIGRSATDIIPENMQMLGRPWG